MTVRFLHFLRQSVPGMGFFLFFNPFWVISEIDADPMRSCEVFIGEGGLRTARVLTRNHGPDCSEPSGWCAVMRWAGPPRGICLRSAETPSIYKRPTYGDCLIPYAALQASPSRPSIGKPIGRTSCSLDTKFAESHSVFSAIENTDSRACTTYYRA